MIGRPSRRHQIDHTGRLRQTESTSAIPSAAPIERPRPTPAARLGRPARPWLKWIIIGVAGTLALLFTWAVVGSLATFSKISDKNNTNKAPALNFLGDVKPGQLQGEGDGRVNVLLIGIGGAKHPGGALADTIIVASFDTKHREVALLSIPRDLYVPINGGKIYNKINTAHSEGEKNAKNSGGGPAVLKKTLKEVLDLPIHYYIRVDFNALQKTVDTLGGVTVDVERPIVDLAYPADNMIDYAPFRLAAGVQTLDGKTALKYARSRHAGGGEGSDFARARRQQKLLEAMKEKAMTVGIVGNPKKIAQIISILGDHVKTDISLSEIERFFQVWKDIDGSKIVNKVLDNGPNSPLIAYSGDERGYILVPRTGDYSQIQEIAHEIFIDPYLRQEKASIALINASGNSTIGNSVIKQLKSYGYTVTDTTLKAVSTTKNTQLVDHSKSKPYTKSFLETRFKVKAISRKDPTEIYDLTLTIGSDYQLLKPKGDPFRIKSSPSVTPTIAPGAELKATSTSAQSSASVSQ